MIELPNNVYEIITKLEQHGYLGFAVGGCIRDTIMKLKPNDWDITTSAKPDEIKKIFSKTIDTGIKHGTVTVIHNSTAYEITTFRIEDNYVDYRRPEKVVFTSSIYHDLARRDFTINSIAYNPKIGLVDPYNGQVDIKNKRIITVGDADKRFQEDALRMLRAIRFSAKLNFTIEDSVLTSIENNSNLIENISYERIRDELSKILISQYPSKIKLLKQTKILSKVLKEFDVCFEVVQNNPYHVYDVYEHTIKAINNIENTIYLRWCMLLHDIAKPLTKTTDTDNIDHFYNHQVEGSNIAYNVLNRLRFDKKSISKICKLILYHDLQVNETEKSVKKAITKIGESMFEDWLKIRRADILAQNPIYMENRLVSLNKIYSIYKKIIKEKQCLTIKNLAINGDDIIKTGISEGKQIGSILSQLLDIVIENPQLNNKDTLFKYIEKLIPKA